MSENYISNAFVSEALDCARRGGVDIGDLLHASGISAPGGGQVTAEQFGLLWLNIAAAMNDEFFGNAARPMRPGSFALMGHATCHAPTVDAALRRALRFLRVAIDEPYGTLTVQSGQAHITLHDTRTDRSAFAYRTFWVILHGLTCWLAQARIPITALDVTCPAPLNSSDYGQFFGVPVCFDAPRGEMRYDAAYLKRPILHNAASLKTFLRGAPGNFLTGFRQIEGAPHLVREHLKSLAPADWPTLPNMARVLDTSSASLRRHLSRHGTTYRAIKADLRREMGLILLREGGRTIAEIAEQLGYAEPSAFYRASRDWIETTPAKFPRAEQTISGE